MNNLPVKLTRYMAKILQANLPFRKYRQKIRTGDRKTKTSGCIEISLSTCAKTDISSQDLVQY